MSAWLDHVWQATLLAVGVVLALVLAGRWLTAATRRLIWSITLGQFLIPGAWMAALIRRIVPSAHHWIELRTVPVQLALPPLHRAGLAVGHRPGVAAVLWLVWAAGAALVVLISVVKTMRLRRQLNEESQEPADHLRERWRVALARAGLPHLEFAPCEVCAAERSPGVIGVLHPVLFVPAGLDRLLSEEELDTVLLHEAVHLQRRDNLWSAVQTVVAAVNWYNPVVWFVSQQLQLETEMSCDERVLGVTRDSGVYLSAIAKSVRHSLGLLAPGFSPAGSTPVGLRLGNILAFPPRASARAASPVAVGMLGAATLMSGYAGGVSGASGRADRVYGEDAPGFFAVRPDAGERAISVLLVRPNGDLRGAPAGAGLTPDMMPVVVERSEPVYPLAPRLAGISGAVLVKYTVEADGGVRDVSVESSDREDFAAAAAEAVQHWKYVPAQRDGAPVAAHLEVKVVFSAQSPLPREVAPQDRPVAVSFR